MSDMSDVSEYVSPDGLLKFQVIRNDHDVSLGFVGSSAHTHADILVKTLGLPETKAIAHFVQQLLTNRSVIVISRIDGLIADIWVSDSPASEGRYLEAGESIELRYWDGTLWMSTPAQD